MAAEDLIELGAVRGAYGLKGWVRIVPFAADGSVLEGVRRWWLLGDTPQPLTLQAVRRHGEAILAKWEGCETKEAADTLKGGVVGVARTDFPALNDGDYYLGDVIGYRVLNREGAELGTVSGVRTGTATQWLEVKQDEPVAGNKGSSLLIPLVDQYVEAIEPSVRTVKVDWHSDW
ncbi:MAG TPA: ribosome maturation factor RimM [Burkholderiaceae bacterium]|nr:ribosome maturation factor RimM [Burkholderiaceae bacterium]